MSDETSKPVASRTSSSTRAGQRKQTDPHAQPEKPAPAIAADTPNSQASPPCFMHEFEDSHFGYLNDGEILELLNMLLEGERAGARALGRISKKIPLSEVRDILRRVGRDEARFCAMLTRHIERIGGTPSQETGAFFEKLMAVDLPKEQIDLLNRGQGWVVKKLNEALPRIKDNTLHEDLRDMLEVHKRNIEKCNQLN